MRVLVPAKSKVELATCAAQAPYARMLAAGVRIWEYLPRALHTKTVVVDHDGTTVGTANFDYRSFFLDDELNLVVDETRFNAELATQFETDLLSEGSDVWCLSAPPTGKRDGRSHRLGDTSMAVNGATAIVAAARPLDDGLCMELSNQA